MSKTIDVDSLLKQSKTISYKPSQQCIAQTIHTVYTERKTPVILIPLSIMSVSACFTMLAGILYFLSSLPKMYIMVIYCIYMFLGLCTALVFALGTDHSHKKGGSL